MNFYTLDRKLIDIYQRSAVPVARIGLFIVFFWFGLLKVIGQSPASQLVLDLFNMTIPFIPFSTFIVLFGLFECLIGILFIIPKLERVALPLFFLHMIMTFLPLVLLPGQTFSGFLVPTMEGQYILKNFVLIAAALSIASRLRPRLS